MNASYFFDQLYPLQDEVLRLLAPLDTALYLTGGTAASRGYLRHRFSEDLDLFANDAAEFPLWADRFVASLAARHDWTTSLTQREARFVRLTVTRRSVALRIELVNDVPSHIGAIETHPVLGRLDSAENILANKLTALADRDEPKDVADVWAFCTAMGLSLSRALEDASSKAAGLFPPDLARRLLGTTEDDWRLVQWISAPPVAGFLADLRRLSEELLLLPPPGR